METRKLRRRRTDGKEGVYKSQKRLGWMISILITILVLYGLFGIWLKPMRVTGDSMAPALLDGEIILSDQLAKYWKIPTRGDLVEFETADGVFIKRIVGLPGETVDISEGKVYIDSRPLEETQYAGNYVGNMEAVTVPEGAVFLLGDNREKVYDSRLKAIGCIPYQDIQGVLRVRVSPLSRITVFF